MIPPDRYCKAVAKSRARFCPTPLTCWLTDTHTGAHYDYDFGVYWYNDGGCAPVSARARADNPVAPVGRVFHLPRVGAREPFPAAA